MCNPRCDCGFEPDLVTDSASGDEICRRCGVVTAAHLLDHTLERWQDVPRATSATDDWLIPKPPSLFTWSSASVKKPRRRPLGNPDPHLPVRTVFETIDNMGHAMATGQRDIAKMLCRDLMEKRPLRSTNIQLFAACALYLASKMDGHTTRSKKEIAASFATFGVTETDLTTTAKVFRSVLASKPYAPRLCSNVDAGDLIFRAVDRLDVDEPAKKRLKSHALAVWSDVPPQEMEGKTPAGVCSGVLACAATNAELGLSKTTLAKACNVSTSTLDKLAKLVGTCVSKV